MRTKRGLIGYLILTAGVIAALLGVRETQDDDRRHARDAYVYACAQRNATILDTNETRDTTADLLEGLRDTLSITNPEVSGLLEEAIRRNRTVIVRQDCKYPPDPPPPAVTATTEPDTSSTSPVTTCSAGPGLTFTAPRESVVACEPPE